MINKHTFKSIGAGFVDFIISFPLFFAVGFIFLLFVCVFHIPDRVVFILFVVGVGLTLLKLIVDTIVKKDKRLYTFWISFVSSYIILLLLIFIAPIEKQFFQAVFLPFLGISYLFLMIKSIKFGREKYGYGSGKFWGYWIGIPIGIILLMIFTVPGIVIMKNRALDTKVNQNIGISNLKEIYKPDTGENGIRFVDAEKIPTNRGMLSFFGKYLKDWSKPIPRSAFKNDIRKSVDLYIPYLDSLSKSNFIQKAWIGDYEDNIFIIPLPKFERMIKIAKAGLISAMFDINKKNYASASDKIEKVWHLAKIIPDNNLISGMVSMVIGNYTMDILYRGINEGWALRKEFKHIINEIPIDVEKMPLVIPGAYEFVENKPARLPGLAIEIFPEKEFFKKSYSKIFSINVSSKYKRFFFDIIGGVFSPFTIYSYPTILKYVSIYIPRKFASKNEWIEYYKENNVKDSLDSFIDYSKRRMIFSGPFLLLVPNMSKTINEEIEYIARARVLKVALSIEEQRKKTGKYPEHLGETLKDPFTGKSLIYKKLKNGYVIYSVGKDETDNRGDVIPPDSKDVGFKK